jgi:hypothetical protein
MLGVNRGGDHRCWAILARNVWWKTTPRGGAVPENLIPSWREGFRADRSRQGRARCLGAAERTLDGEDRSENIPAGRNGPLPVRNMADR